MRTHSLAFFIGLGLCIMVSLASSAGCGTEDRLPPRPGAPYIVPGGAGGAGGAGGSDIGTDYYCGCISTLGATTCATCVNNSGDPGAPCEQKKNLCHQDPGCVGILECLSNCDYQSECAQACYLPWDLTESHTRFRDMIYCACNVCGGKCAPQEPVMCVAPDAGS